MKIVNGAIAEATRDEMYDYYLKWEWHTAMPLTEYLSRCKKNGTKMTDDEEDGK